MNARYEAGRAEANATLEAQRIAAADAQAAITQAAEVKLSKLQLQVSKRHCHQLDRFCRDVIRLLVASAGNVAWCVCFESC